MRHNGHNNATSELRSEDERDRLLHLYEAVLSTTPDLIYVFDLDHRFTFANDALLQMWGKTWDEARGKNCLELGYERWHAEMHDREIDQVIATKRSIRGEVDFTGMNGRRTYDYIFSPVIGDDGEVRAITGTTRDISERTKAESDLKRAMDFDEAIMSSMSEGLYTVDSVGSIVTMNRAAERLFGIKLDDVRGRNFHNVVHYLHPDGTPFPAEECETLKNLKEGKTVTNNREVFIRGDGTMFDAAYNSAPISIGNEVTGSVVVFRDVTEENRIADELRTSAARIRIAVEAARQVTWEWDLVRDLIYWNDGDRSVFGNTNAKSPSSSGEFFKVLHIEDLEAVRSRIVKAAAERSVIDVDFRTIRENGTVRWISVYGQVTEWDDKGATRVSGVAADITERKQTEETIGHQKLLLEAVTDSVLDGILFVAPDGKMLLHNQQFLDIWNFPKEIVESKSDEAALKWAAAQTTDPAAFLARVGEIYDHPDGRFREEMPMKDGRVFERFGAPVQTGEDRLGWVWTFRDISARKQAEEMTRESEEKYRSLFDSIDEGVCTMETLVDANGNPVDFRVLELNAMFEEMSGLVNAKDKTVLELIPGLDDSWIQTYGKVALTGESTRFENYVEPLDRWFDVFVSRVGDIASRRLVVVFRNITESRRTELNLVHLAEISEELANLTSIGEMMQSIGTKIGTYLDLSICAFVEINEAMDEAAINYAWHRKDAVDVVGVYRLSEYLTDDFQKVGRAGEPFVVCDTAADLRTDTAQYAALDIGAFLSVPSIEDGQWRFSLITYHSRPHKWLPDEIELIRTLASHIWMRLGRARTEDALRISEERYRSLFAAAPMALFVCDRNAVILNYNAVAAELWGREPACGVERHCGSLKLWLPDGQHLPHEQSPMVEVLRTGIPARNVEVSIERPDGSRLPLLVNFAALKDAYGEVTGSITSFTDITERKQAENALFESENRLRTLVDSISQLAWMAEPDGSIFWYNRRWYEYTGTTPEQMEGWGWQSVHDPDVLPDVLKGWRNSIENGVPFEMEFPLLGADGVFRWFLTRVNPVRDADGNIVRWFGTNTDVDESRRISEALRESEERRHLAQDAGKVGVWDWNIKAGKTYWSDTMWKLYGEPQRQINPDETFWSARLHASDRERVKSHIQQVIESGENDFHDEFRIITNEGTIRWVDSKATVSRDTKDEAIRMYGVNLDITERKDAEERLRLSENQLRLVTNAVPALISYVDGNERYRFVNQQFHDWFGIPTEELVGKKVRNVFGSPAYKVLKPYIDEALSGKQVAFETTITYQAAGTRSVHISYMPDIGVDGTVYGYYGLTNDLTEFKRAQDLLRSSEERMALMVENVTDYAILSTDSDGRIDSWNIGAEMIFGYTPDEITGLPCDILFTAEDSARGIPIKEMRTARLKGRASDERWQLRKDGTRFFADVVTMPLRVGDVLTGYAKIASDLTEKQRRAEELQRAHDQLDLRVRERTRELAESNLALVQEMEVREVAERQRIDLLGRLVTGQEVERRRIARDLHDQLGQRLTALRLNIASLKEFSAGDSGIESRVEHLQEIGEKLDAEVSFLAWELRPTALDDLGLVDAVGAFVNEWSRHYEIEADFHSSGLSKERLNRDTETHLYRITQEALNNILKHAGAGLVTVMLEKRDDSVILIIEDDGCGFDMTAVKSSAESGLGLVGMSERAALVGGDLEVESSSGTGTTIFVRIPGSN